MCTASGLVNSRLGKNMAQGLGVAFEAPRVSHGNARVRRQVSKFSVSHSLEPSTTRKVKSSLLCFDFYALFIFLSMSQPATHSDRQGPTFEPHSLVKSSVCGPPSTPDAEPLRAGRVQRHLCLQCLVHGTSSAKSLCPFHHTA